MPEKVKSYLHSYYHEIKFSASSDGQDGRYQCQRKLEPGPEFLFFCSSDDGILQ
jgi:hypothetical protein